jgi:hypothetical protein
MKNKNQLFKIEGFSKDENPSVLINGIQLECDQNRSTGFSWGYGGTGPNALAAAILEKFIPLENRTKGKGKNTTTTSEFEDLKKAFAQQIIGGWGYGDFMINIDMKHWLRIYGHYTGPIIFQHHIADDGEKW